MGTVDLDDKQVIDIKLELCCDICNNPKVSVKREASNSSSNNTEDLRLQDGFDDTIHIITDTINPSVDQPQNAIHQFQTKYEVNSDPDIEVNLAYRIIDTFNPCEVKMFKQEDEKISPDNKTLYTVGQTNIIQPHLKVDKNPDYMMTNNLNICEKKKRAFVKENVDYDNQKLSDDVNKNPADQRQSKGM